MSKMHKGGNCVDKWVFHFDDVVAASPHLLGDKGARLMAMASEKLPVPCGFILTTEAYHAFRCSGGVLPPSMLRQIREHMHDLEQKTGRRFGQSDNPLFVSVGSGAPGSIPGMMATVLHLGLNDDTIVGLAEQVGDSRTAVATYLHFIHQFANAVLGIPLSRFARSERDTKAAEHETLDQDLSTEQLQRIISQSLALVRNETGQPFPQDPADQLFYAIQAVFRSWENPQAISYRHHHHIADELGTSIIVQRMIVDKFGEASGSGVVGTRSTSTGVNELHGEFFTRSNRDDTGSESRTPYPIARLKQDLPAIYDQLTHVCDQLERRFGDAQDIEFMIEQGKLYVSASQPRVMMVINEATSEDSHGIYATSGIVEDMGRL